MFACLCLPSFRLQAALRWREWRGAAVLVDEASSKGIVLEANAAAERKHIRIGMTATQAMAHDQRVLILPRAPEQETCLQQMLAERGFSLAPEVEVAPEGYAVVNMQNVAVTLCWQQMADAQIAWFREQGLILQVGVAGTPDLAILAAKGAGSRAAIIYDGPAYVAPLAVAVLEPSEELARVLADWGIHTVGAFLALPGSEVTERLGAEAQDLRRKVSCQYKRPLRLVRVAPEYGEAFDFDYEVETSEPLLFLLRRFLETLCGRLGEAYRVAQSLRLSIILEDKSRHERLFRMPAPTAEVAVLYRVLETYLETLTLPQRPTGLRLRLEPAEPLRDQLGLFESALRDPNRFGETLARLKALYGNDAVGVPVANDSHRPDDFHLEDHFLSTTSESEPVMYGLPLRRFRPARPVAVQMTEGRPTRMEAGPIQGGIRECAGPYVLSGHWWDRERWATEEWDVALEDGGLYRLSRQERRWLVEGCYEVR